ncbi:hypothetical protein TWF694_001672 [Orbilia ellipsospora]|uniref:Uncharacterized protein n=1 Tax=Orbilia ellipsospora TaxID=2528407 RepID=A0AAV9X3A2_9PEZI
MPPRASKKSRVRRSPEPAFTPRISHQMFCLLRWLLAIPIRKLNVENKVDADQLTPGPRDDYIDHTSPYYTPLVLEKDNVRIIKSHQIDSLHDFDMFGENVREMVLNIQQNIVDRPLSEGSTVSLVDSISNSFHLTSIQKSMMIVRNFFGSPNVNLAFEEELDLWDASLNISELCAREEPRAQYSATNGRKRKRRERELQDFLTDDARIFKKLKSSTELLTGKPYHRINNAIGPKNVIDNIPNYITPDYIWGYQHHEAQTAFSIDQDVMRKIPEALLWMTPEAKRSPALLLPYLAMELKRSNEKRTHCVLENEVQQQLARCLSVLVERQASLEQIFGQVSSTPVFGITFINDQCDLWVMVRTRNPSTIGCRGWLTIQPITEINYYMCQIASYKLSNVEDLRGFVHAMAKIREWERNERRKHFEKLFRTGLQTAVISAVQEIRYVHALLSAWSRA